MSIVLFTPTEVSELLKIPESTLAQWRWRSIGPVSLRVGRHVRYYESDVQSWLLEQSRTRRPGGDAG